MKLLVAAVGVAEEVDVDLDAVVVVEVALAVIFLMMITHFLPLEPPLMKVLLKEILETPQKDAVMVLLGHLIAVAVVVVAVAVLATVKLVKMDAHGEHLNATVGPDEEVGSNVKVLDVVTGEHSLMKLLRSLRKW